ncbi:cytochrome ubiquinol oxidase subunit I [Francisellaceae bacterium]|nr:cytochrome ubiquinol oxidase subunit I [Francisellaceae bacterium]
MLVPELSELTLDLSRIQFAFTAMFHFLFVPLTLGLSWILVVMEAAYLKTGKPVYQDMVKFWGKIFAINFAMGVLSGITMEFEFGLNWAYFSRFIGESFGSILAIEGITAFMIEAILFGLFYFTWDKVNKKTHFAITFFLALATNMSIVNILVANSWMQHPVGSVLNPETMSMQLYSFAAMYGQQLAQIRVGHVAFAGYIVASTFVMGISCWYLLRKRDVGFAMRSLAVAVGFGFCASIFTFFLGDANGLAVAKEEPVKMAAMEGQWVTQKAPASWVAVSWISQVDEKDEYAIKIPWMLSLIADHNLTGTVEGLKPIMVKNHERMKEGLVALKALTAIRNKVGTPKDYAVFDPSNMTTAKYRDNIGYAFLLEKYTKTPFNATPHQVELALKDSIPFVPVLFYGFRIMLGCWGLLILIFILNFVFTLRGTVQNKPWLLKAALFAIPLPYIAAEAGWVIAEVGRQPWVIKGIMPTSMGVSTLDSISLIFSLGFFVLFYAILIGVEIFLMFKVARKGPSSLGTGRYHLEQNKVAH